MHASIQVLIADDHEIFRDGFKVMLRKQTELEIIGEAENGQQLVTLAGTLKPDVVITDIKMPLLDGIEATRKIKQLYPGIEVIALSMFDEENLVLDMMEAGAKGYLLKNTTKTEVLQAVKTVYKGENYYCSSTTNKLAALIAKSNHVFKTGKKQAFNENEIEIIKLICREQSNKEIAAALNLSIRTIEGYREKILEKIGAKNVAGVVIYAIKNNIYQV